MDKAAVSHGSAHDPVGASVRVHALWWPCCPVSVYSIQVSQTRHSQTSWTPQLCILKLVHRNLSDVVGHLFTSCQQIQNILNASGDAIQYIYKNDKI